MGLYDRTGEGKLFFNQVGDLVRGLGFKPTNKDVAGVLGNPKKEEMNTMWTEQVDDHNLASKVWPRAAALAERLWSMPSHGWELAEHRMIYHRQRLVERGVNAERLQPEWCLQNQDLCYINKE